MRLSMVRAWSVCRSFLSGRTTGMAFPFRRRTRPRRVRLLIIFRFQEPENHHCNGKDVFDSMNAMTEAREYALLNRNPVIVHANCVRIGSHSNSDKHTLYRDEGELAYVKLPTL